MDIIADAYDKAMLLEGEAQRVNETAGLADLVGKFISDNRCANRFAGEEKDSSCTYPPGYTGPKPIEEQITGLAKILGLDPTSALAFAKNLPALPEGAEGWFAIPSTVALAAKLFPNLTDPAEQNFAGVSLILSMVAASRDFSDYLLGPIETTQLRVATRTAGALVQITEAQDMSDILIIAAQFGLLHRGESVRRAREVMDANQFGLGALAVGSMLLTHPERLQHYDYLWIDCAGDEFSPGPDGEFGSVPCFNFSHGRVEFDTCSISDSSAYCGSASAFLPQ